jgi:hypothetical protein
VARDDCRFSPENVCVISRESIGVGLAWHRSQCMNRSTVRGELFG